jgi:hypothetical protein
MLFAIVATMRAACLAHIIPLNLKTLGIVVTSWPVYCLPPIFVGRMERTQSWSAELWRGTCMLMFSFFMFCVVWFLSLSSPSLVFLYPSIAVFFSFLAVWCRQSTFPPYPIFKLRNLVHEGERKKVRCKHIYLA